MQPNWLVQMAVPDHLVCVLMAEVVDGKLKA